MKKIKVSKSIETHKSSPSFKTSKVKTFKEYKEHTEKVHIKKGR